MKTPLRSAIAVMIAATTAAAVGCTSSSSGGSGGGTSSYCAALSSYAAKCNITDPCMTATLENCSASAGAYSSSFLAAVTNCAAEATCADGGGAAAAACSASVTTGLTPTPTQQKLAADVCAMCAAAQSETTAECEQTFYETSTDGGIGGIGSFLLEYSDSIASSIDTQCVPLLSDAGLLGCDFPLLECASTQIAKTYAAPTACTTTSGSGSSADGG